MGLRVNLGCGRSPQAGWVNLDAALLPGVDVVADLDRCRTQPLPFADDSVSEFRLAHVLEHIGDTLALMQELHRVAAPGAHLLILTPYGSSDGAYEDPTHRQRFFVNSFVYFAQPMYWRADYGYRGDWHIDDLTLVVDRAGNEGLPADALLRKINAERNVVREMRALLRAIKPIRPPDRALLAAPHVNIQLI